MSEMERLGEKIWTGLEHCAPAGDEPGGCAGCSYYRAGCACEKREMVALPNDMVNDFRSFLAEYRMMNMEGANG